MFRLNLKIALRSLWKHKSASLINIAGLAIGLAASLMLMLYVAYQLNYDKAFPDSRNIYQVLVNFYDNSGNVSNTGVQTPNTLQATLKEEIPEVENVGRLLWPSMRLVANGQNAFKIESRYADPEILKIFQFRYLSGSAEHAFDDPKSIILTERTAKKLFGTTDVLNRVVRFENQVDLKVTAVISDLAPNITYGFESLAPWKLYEKLNDWAAVPNWFNYSYFTLLTLRKGTDVGIFNQKIKQHIRHHAASKSVDAVPFIYPLLDYHLYGQFVNGRPSGGQIEQVKIFVVLGLGILAIACINFMNLATARSQKRAKEVGIKKTIGASRFSLVSQFLVESFILTIISVIVAIILVELFLPKFNNLIGTQLQLNYGDPINWMVTFGLILITGLIAGSYPAFYLSSFHPIQTFKKGAKITPWFIPNLRQVLVVIQFSFAVVLIIATLVVYRQLQHVKNRPIGFDAEALVEMPHEGNLYVKFDLLKERLLQSGAVTAMCQSSGSIAYQNSNNPGLEWEGMAEIDRKRSFDQLFTTYDFIKTNHVKLLEGRDFDKKQAADSLAVMLNQTAVKLMNFKHPIGQYIRVNGQKRKVVGYFADVLWGEPGLKERPMVVVNNPNVSDYITMRLNNTRSTKENLEAITRITKQINPDFPVDIKFVDSLIAEKVEHERTLGILSNIFGCLAIFISCLGLFALAAFSAEQRTKEIGVRKVLGASVAGIISLLSFSFIRTVLVAIFIAMPVAYLLMRDWLMKYDYRISFDLDIFVITTVLTIGIALISVGWQAYTAAKANPVDALKYE